MAFGRGIAPAVSLLTKEIYCTSRARHGWHRHAQSALPSEEVAATRVVYGVVISGRISADMTAEGVSASIAQPNIDAKKPLAARSITMVRSTDPTVPICEKAASFPQVTKGTSCNQSSFKVGKGSFLFIGPGAKRIGFKAMFRLGHSMPQARKLASKEPERFEVGSTGWVTTRFTAEKPLPKSIWGKWLQESYDICCGSSKNEKRVEKKSAGTPARTKKSS